MVQHQSDKVCKLFFMIMFLLSCVVSFVGLSPSVAYCLCTVSCPLMFTIYIIWLDCLPGLCITDVCYGTHILLLCSYSCAINTIYIECGISSFLLNVSEYVITALHVCSAFLQLVSFFCHYWVSS